MTDGSAGEREMKRGALERGRAETEQSRVESRVVGTERLSVTSDQ